MSGSRKELIDWTVACGILDIDLVLESSDEEDSLDTLCKEVLILNHTRYLHKNYPVPKSVAWFEDVLPYLDEKRFKTILRVSRFQFSILLDLLVNLDIFQTTKNQLPTATQLAIVLTRVGSYGSGCSVVKLASFFGIGDGGTIDRITLRIFTALLTQENTHIIWPSREERVRMTLVEDYLLHCVGYLDGSEFHLAEAPCTDHTSYYSRKQRYSIKAQAICDNQLRIRYLNVGFPGSVHDARIFNNSGIGKNPSKYLSDSQWLALDSAYKLTENIITPFRKNSSFRTLREREKFNKYFSGYRVKIEQCFGILKEKFSSLKELRIHIKDPQSHKFVCCWIRVCVIIHNLL